MAASSPTASPLAPRARSECSCHCRVPRRFRSRWCRPVTDRPDRDRHPGVRRGADAAPELAGSHSMTAARLAPPAPAAPAPTTLGCDPRWVRPALAGLLGTTALLYLWGLGAA